VRAQPETGSPVRFDDYSLDVLTRFLKVNSQFRG